MAKIDSIIAKIKKLFANFELSDFKFGSSAALNDYLEEIIWQETNLAKNYMTSDLGGE